MSYLTHALLCAVVLAATIISFVVPLSGEPGSLRSGPDLPYSCAVVRMAAALYSRKQLEQMAHERGLTPRQRAQALACLEPAAATKR